MSPESKTNSSAINRICDILLDTRTKTLDPDTKRRAQFLVLATSLTAVAGLLSAAVHQLVGEPTRALFAGLSSFFVFSGILVFRLTGRMTAAAHAFCGTAAFFITISPFLETDAIPIPISLISLPLAAAAIGNARSGTLWTLLAFGILAGHAFFFPYSPSEASFAWLSSILAVACGTGAIVFESSRARAIREADAATAEARADSAKRQAAEAALIENQALFSAAFHRAPSVMILSDLEDLKLLDVNDGFVETSGWTREEAVGHTLTELGIWPNTDERDKLIQLLLEEGKTKAVELLLRTRSGGSVWLLASAELIHLSGRILLLSQGIDITDRKNIEDERKRLNEELEERFAARGRELEDSLSRIREKDRLSSIGTLAAGIAHQINNPISGIVAAAQFALLIEDEEERSKVREDALVTALSEAKRCGRIVKNVLKFARDEPTAKWIEDLGPEVLRACQLARPYIAEQSGRLEVELQNARLMVRMSPIDIEQALINVLRNAAESSRAGSQAGGRLIRVETRKQGRWAQIRVTDDGPGIDASLRSRVLDPFYTSREGHGGTGLGLSVAHGIMRDHGGRIRIERAEGGGARVTLELPLVETREERRDPHDRPASDTGLGPATPPP